MLIICTIYQFYFNFQLFFEAAIATNVSRMYIGGKIPETSICNAYGKIFKLLK